MPRKTAVLITILEALGITLAILCHILVFWKQSNRHIKSASIPVAHLTVFGVCLQFLSGTLFVSEITPLVCRARLWLQLIGFNISFSACFSKVLSVNMLMNVESIKNGQVNSVMALVRPLSILIVLIELVSASFVPSNI